MAHIVCVSARMASAAQPGYFHWLAIVFVVSDDERHIVVSAHFAGLWRDDPEDLSRPNFGMCFDLEVARLIPSGTLAARALLRIMIPSRRPSVSAPYACVRFRCCLVHEFNLVHHHYRVNT